MKKVLVLMLVLCMATMANAAIIDVTVDGVGSNTHLGTPASKLDSGETIHIAVVLNFNSYYGGTSTSAYDGYITDALSLDLAVTGGGSLGAEGTLLAKGFVPDAGAAAAWDVLDYHGYQGTGTFMNDIVSDTMSFAYGSLTLVAGTDDPTKIIWDMYVTADGTGDILVDMSNVGGRWAADSWNKTWSSFGTGDVGGQLVISAVPEPMTIALLGLGGLFLRRRKK